MIFKNELYHTESEVVATCGCDMAATHGRNSGRDNSGRDSRPRKAATDSRDRRNTARQRHESEAAQHCGGYL
jgi:hypothetical protein